MFPTLLRLSTSEPTNIRQSTRRVFHTTILEFLDSRNHFTVELARGGMGRWAVTRSVIVLQVLRVGAVAYGPLRTLFDGEKAERAVAFS